jgi:phosphate starvation-inducible PhoH-like protein
LSVDQQYKVKLEIDDNEQAYRLFGNQDEHLAAIEREFPVKIVSRGNEVLVSGEKKDVDVVVDLLRNLMDMIRHTGSLGGQDVAYGIRLAQEGNVDKLMRLHSNDVVVETARGRRIRPKTVGQKLYVEAMKENGITISIGPAGTGKTYLAMAMAVSELKSRDVSRIILTRPAVEAGENLGFLPGDMQDKVDPYLRPLYDALYDILGVDTFDEYMSRGIIEVAPLAYMRGRTLDDSFVILDEAQNTTSEQMKMFLTRLGFGSKAVVTGDITQVDLPQARYSGLEEVRVVLKDIDGIEFIYLTDRDVVRHPLVQDVIKAYERYEKKQQGDDSAPD